MRAILEIGAVLRFTALFFAALRLPLTFVSLFASRDKSSPVSANAQSTLGALGDARAAAVDGQNRAADVRGRVGG